MNLSKSLYTRGLQCHKSLWLKKHQPEYLSLPSKERENIQLQGNMVGDVAHGLFPNGVEIPFEGSTFEEKIVLTQDLINSGQKIIYEATFQHDGILVMVDIFTIEEDVVRLFEVKSSSGVSPIYLHDASIQYYVLNGLGYDVQSVSIVHINTQYERVDTLELHKLFKIVDVTEAVLELQSSIPTRLQEFESILSTPMPPLIDIGTHCTDPYECDAKTYCWSHIPPYSIFNISRLTSTKKFELYTKNVLRFEQIDDFSPFNAAQKLQITAELEQSEHVNHKAIAKFLSALTYPLYHLDFETFTQAIPMWSGIRPFMQIPFQYSLHIEQIDETLTHKEFLAPEGVDPRLALATQLTIDIPDNVTILAYNMSFEKGVIKNLATLYPHLSNHLMAIHDNIHDLMTPFSKKEYYTPSMKGSYSIKKVLPALVPEFEKGYESLDLIHNGADASSTYATLHTIEDNATKERIKEALLAYCKLDTLAMVKILQKLRESVN